MQVQNIQDSQNVQDNQNIQGFKNIQDIQNNQQPESIQVGTEVKLKVETVIPGGAGLARIGAKVCFIDFGLPGQELLVKIKENKSKYLRAIRQKVLVKSVSEISPFCPYFGNCGGCLWQELDYSEQLFWKNKHLAETLSRLGQIDLSETSCLDIIPSPKIQQFRNKMELAFGRGADNSLIIGLRQRNGKEIIEIDFCPIAAPVLTKVLQTVRSWLKKINSQEHLQPYLNELSFLVIRNSEYNSVFILQLIAKSNSTALFEHLKIQELVDLLQAEHSDLQGFVFSGGQKNTDCAFAEDIIFKSGCLSLTEKINEQLFTFSYGSFFQTNIGVAALLQQEVIRQAKLQGHELVWDIYAGTGFFSLGLSSCARQVLAFEMTESAKESFKDNAKLNNISNAEFICGDVLKTLVKEKQKPDVIVLDPPRLGLHKNFITELKKIEAKKIILVSCDMATLARDLKLLLEKYRLLQVQALDMFPHGPCVEVVCSLELKAV